jgi:hypothetical protein
MDKLNKNVVVARREMNEEIILNLSFDSNNSHSLNVIEEMNSRIWNLRMGHLKF